jgi:hypothetical protein
MGAHRPNKNFQVETREKYLRTSNKTYLHIPS